MAWHTENVVMRGISCCLCSCQNEESDGLWGVLA